jgi:polysaccharide export outer membrane protein
MYKQSWRVYGILFVFFAYICNSSCISAKKVTYFYDVPDSASATNPFIINPTTPFVEPKIETNDILSITIQTIEQNPSNTPITSLTQGTFSPLSGFLVDKNGYVELSLIGFVKVGGLTTSEARELVKQKAKEFYKEPVVNLRIANFDVEVLGDFGRVGPVNIPSEKATIVDVIALAGDLNSTAKRKNILLIRTEGDQKKFVRLDITSSKIFQSPYLYVKQRDILYVEPNRYKRESSDQTFVRDLGILSGVLSLVSLIFIFQSIKF